MWLIVLSELAVLVVAVRLLVEHCFIDETFTIITSFGSWYEMCFLIAIHLIIYQWLEIVLDFIACSIEV